MAIIPNWLQFRLLFGIGGTTSNQLQAVSSGVFSYNSGTPPTITRALGDFIVDGQLADMRADVTGTAFNDGRYGPLTIVEAKKLTLSDTDTLQSEPISGSDITSIFRDNDEVESFPSIWHPTIDLVRSGGFDGGIEIVTFDFAEIALTVNNGVSDTVTNDDEYHWYLEQKQDLPSRQYLTIEQIPNDYAGGSLRSYSGSVIIKLTTLAFTELGGVVGSTFIRELFKMCDLYVKRITDGAIQWVNIYLLIQQP